MKAVSRKVVLVGRYVSDLPDEVEVIAQDNILWDLDFEKCQGQWYDLQFRARDAGAAILLQDIPEILAAVMMQSKRMEVHPDHATVVRVGVIINVPNSRSVSKTKEFTFTEWHELEKAQQAVLFANGRAMTDYERLDDGVTPRGIPYHLKVTVDPIATRIEWF